MSFWTSANSKSRMVFQKEISPWYSSSLAGTSGTAGASCATAGSAPTVSRRAAASAAALGLLDISSSVLLTVATRHGWRDGSSVRRGDGAAG